MIKIKKIYRETCRGMSLLFLLNVHLAVRSQTGYIPFSVTQNPPLVVTAAATDVTCNGACNGTASASPTGGTSPYTYFWSNGSNSVSITGLCFGIFTVTVTDANLCTATATDTITDPAALTASISAQTNVSCNGGSNGSATVTAGGGTAPYTYVWNDPAPAQSTATVTGLTAGTWTVTVTDANNCTTMAISNITEPTVLTTTITGTGALCNGASTGSATVTVTGGTQLYTYLWDAAAGNQSTPTASGLGAGIYSVTVTDANSCITTNSYTVTEPSVLTATPSSINSTCGASNGTASVSVTGGTGGYSYDWSPNGYTGDGTNTYSALPSGSYTVTVTDGNGCTASQTITVNNSNGPTASILSQTNVLCNGGANGQATATQSGGTGPYSYVWNDPAPAQSTATATGLTAGTWTVTVTDANGCFATASVTITQPASQLTTSVSTTDVLCFADTSGSANLTVSGGTSPYSYHWSNNATTEDLIQVNAGFYDVTVTDNNLCTTTASVIITQPASWLSSNIFKTNVGCYGDSTGSAQVIASGGTAPYTYQWSNLSIQQFNNNLTAGTYSVTVTDANLCTDTASVIITQPALILTNVQLSICDGDSIFLSGGWQSAGGSYNDTLISVNSCDSIVVTGLTVNPIPQTSGITGPLTVIENELKQYYVADNTGSTYQWTVTNGTIAGGQGTNMVFIQWGSTGFGTLQVIETNNGCSGEAVSIIVTIGNVIPCDSMQIAVSGQNILCNGQCNGIASVQVLHGNPPYTYIWNDAYYQQTSAIFNLCPGTYSVTVTDHYNCTASSNYIVTQPADLTLNITTTSASCEQDNGSASATVTGGTQPYTFAWTSGSTQSLADSLAAGMYMLTVTDANNCSKFTLASISNTNGPVITASSITNLTCYGSGNGAINITVSGGTFPYTFSWTTGATTEDISNLTEGPYEIEITDMDGCMATASYFVNQPNQLNAVATTTPATCGNTNGAATITVTGGTQPYTFAWSNSGTNATQTGLAPGVYSVTVTDSHSCSANPVMVNINTSGGPVITIDSVVQAGCSGSDGAIYTSVSGGAQPYIYSWSNGSTTPNIQFLISNIYTLTVTDTNNCIAATSVEITGIVPPVPQICIVTVDTTEQKNLIVWEKEVTTTIDHYNVYREGSWAGYYFLAGSVGYTQYSQFLDTNSNPQMRAYRYKITAVDLCGNESPASEPHKTIHLAINDGIGNSWNLIWTEYEGFYFPGYYIYRHTTSQGWTLLDSIATGYNSYTDWPPSMGQLYYRIGVFKNDTCYPSGDLKAQGGPYSQSFSNLDDNEIPVAIVSVNNTGCVSVYPNPANNTVIIEGLQAGKIELMNIQGQVIKNIDVSNEKTSLDISKLSCGVYIIRIQTNDGIIMKKLVKE